MEVGRKVGRQFGKERIVEREVGQEFGRPWEKVISLGRKLGWFGELCQGLEFQIGVMQIQGCFQVGLEVEGKRESVVLGGV
uniref:Uncharacterized protein n=1 Tax=Arcella intermedia TaxID=1963864 RepID=A0A6B2LIK3_9EUKA